MLGNPETKELWEAGSAGLESVATAHGVVQYEETHSRGEYCDQTTKVHVGKAGMDL
jgi:hypothetical protein